MRYSAVVRFISPLYGQRFVKWFTTTFVTYTDFLGKDNIYTDSLTGLVKKICNYLYYHRPVISSQKLIH